MKTLLFACAIVVLANPLLSQSPRAARHKFDVASIKSNPAGGEQIFIDARPGPRFVCTNISVRLLLRQAFRPLQDSQIVGGSDWMNSDRFDIEARAEQPLSQSEMAEALQSLLEERFELKTHRDMKELSVYLLTVGKGGPKLKAVDPPSPAGGPTFAAAGYFKGTARPMTAVANFLSPLLGRPVVDKTEMKEFYDIELHFDPNARAVQVDGQAPATPSDSPTIFTAVQEQLGLKLDSGRAIVEVLVVDSVSKPMEN